MKKKYFINANIIDPYNSLNETGGLIIDENGKIEGVGKKVNTNNIPSREKVIDLKGKHIFPGLVDMRVFVGEPGFEYKENFRTLSEAALSGGVTSVVTMPNTNPVIDNVSIVDFLRRRGRDKSKINIFPTAALTVNTDVLPGAEQLAEIREVIEHEKVNCIFSEPQFNPSIIKTIAKDTNIKTGVLDPLGSTLNKGKGMYSELLNSMSSSFKGC